MKKTLTLNKPLGKTPLEVLDAWKLKHPQYHKTKMAYAGRLDPMAEGKLLVLVGEECKRREKYLGLDKEYEFEILLGVSSDTHDILGITKLDDSVAVIDNLETVLSKYRGVFNLRYPVFSSKTVDGKTLFLWALENRLSEIQIPTKKVEVYELEQISGEIISKDIVLQTVRERISLVTQVTEDSKQLGRDFRRNEVLERWKENMDVTEQNEFFVLKLRCVCSSGTYMRTLASEIGKELGGAGLAWSIRRTKIGCYKGLLRSFGLWTKKY